MCLTEGARKGRGTSNGVVVARDHASWRAWACSNSWIAAQHGNTRAILGTAERDHVLADVASDNLTVLHACIGQDVLDEVVSKLISSNYAKIITKHVESQDFGLTVNQGHARTIGTTLAHALQISVKELGVTNLETLLDDLGSILIHAVLGGEAEDVVDGTTTIGGSPMLTDVLDAPVAKLTVSDDIDAGEDFVNARTL